MIWYTCKKCNKPTGRPDNLAGTMVFCECGHGNTVPWQSTTTPPETPPAPTPRRAPPPPPRPRPVDDRDRGRPLPRPPRVDDWDDPPPPPAPAQLPHDDASAGDLLRRRKAHVFRRRRPGFCFNHDDIATDKLCADCKEPFCPDCIVEMQGATLCGPCKNFRIRGLHRPARVPGMAIVALILGLVSGPVTFCLTMFGAGGGQGGNPLWAVFLSVFGLLLPAVGLVVSWFALREIETKPNLGGRGLAMTGATSSLIGALWCATVAFLVILHMAQG